MTVTDAIRHRRAVRSFTEQAVEESALRALIDAAIQAPGALNAQPWAFVVLDDRALLADYDKRAKAHSLALEFPEPHRSQAREILSATGISAVPWSPGADRDLRPLGWARPCTSFPSGTQTRRRRPERRLTGMLPGR